MAAKVKDWGIIITLAAMIISGVSTAAVAFYRLGKVESRVKENENRADTDHDLLIRIDATVQTIDRRLQSK